MTPTHHLSRTLYAESGLIWLMAFWLLLLGASLVWNLSQAEHQRKALAYQSARSFYDLIVLMRRWNAEHGGVYVPVTPKMPPNPYLEYPMRDIRVSDQLTLTKVTRPI
ncbi:hypothetical protein GWK36_01695 [Caldichromatium japonicum]|uniref:Uncharacterized protein n=1 Tax=Caldichromatium japonicum TaxID=2699430 RepID=A0A6G7VAC0_9GAMM|nr:hypothetical protein [Caldichromatium japonicum]QIK36924.1 hypothetical protein GWK36_01695 [Caldichromatium japonicum]